jgi:hypothetical protein
MSRIFIQKILAAAQYLLSSALYLPVYLGLLALAQLLSLAGERVLRTSAFVAQPRPAVATP